jgi:hypothetical protein
VHGTLILTMRVNLTAKAHPLGTEACLQEGILLTVRPSTRVPGDFSYTISGKSLLSLLRNSTDLQASIIEKFARDLMDTKTAKLVGVEVNDQVLTEIGYFID